MQARKVETGVQCDRDLHSLEMQFFEAIKNNDEKTVVTLLQKDDFREYIDGADKLSLAFVQVILLNNVELLKVLVQHGVDIGSTDCMFEENGVMHAARYGHADMLRYLLSAGVGVNKQSQNGSTALHVAVENYKHECLEILAGHAGVDLDIKDCSGFSPLLWTARMRDWHAMKILIDAGCKIDSMDFKKGINAMHMCADSKRAFWKGKQATQEDVSKCMDLLVGGGLDLNAGDIYGNPPVLYAIHSHNIPALKKLLQLNCKLDFTGGPIAVYYFGDELRGNDMMLLSLYIAIEKLQLDSVKLLCAAGVKYHRLAREPDVVGYSETRSEALHQWLVDALGSPVTLKQSCRSVIRQNTWDRNDMDKVRDGLGLPRSVLTYLFDIDMD